MKAPASGRRQLSVQLYESYVGEMVQDESGRIGFHYAPDYVASGPGLPLSVAMPVVAAAYGGRVVEPFLWGLLPENPLVLERLARDHHVSAGNPVALLSIIGEDCAGAVSFLAAGRQSVPPAGAVAWLSEREVGALLAGLRQGKGSLGRTPEEAGQFSLGGAQPKTALHRDATGKRWGKSSGGIPTTHILKPPMAGLPGQAENEHFCLRLAQALGCPAADSEVMEFAGEQAIVVARYDRLRGQGETVLRLHQEDLCQALSVLPSHKYQREGGPGLRDASALITTVSASPKDDLERFMRAAAVNFVILGTDAHAKNFSLIIAPSAAGPLVRLAPLYDLNSYLPYQDNPRKTRLAMSVGGRYLAAQIMPRHWAAEAAACGLAPEAMLGILRDVIARAPELARQVAGRCQADGLRAAILPQLAGLIAERCQYLARHYA